MSGATASKDSKVKDENNLHMYMTDLFVVLFLAFYDYSELKAFKYCTMNLCWGFLHPGIPKMN